MSSKLDKLLENAQKFIAKGQVDRAIKEYEQIVVLEKGDIRYRQKLAELLVRGNRKVEAIAQYEAIGKNYSENFFYLKAIAVYKQIQKLNPTNIKTTLTLASLNGKQGLIGNALAEYGLAVNYYEKAGLLTDAINVIEQMLAVDPENLNTYLKFAETCFAAGLSDKAYGEFTQLALRLRKQGDDSAFSRVCERVQSLYPDRKDFRLDILAVQIEEGAAHSTIPTLRSLVEKDKNNLKAWQLLAAACLKTGDNESWKSVLQDIAELFPGELSAVEALIRSAIAEGDSSGALDLLKIHEARFTRNGAVESLQELYASLLEVTPKDSKTLPEQGNADEEPVEDDNPAENIANLDTLEQEIDLPIEAPIEPDAEEETEIPAPLQPSAPVSLSNEIAWEEDIDLSLLDETSSGPQTDQEAGEFLPGALPGEAEAPEQYGEMDFFTADTGALDAATFGEIEFEPEAADQPTIFQEEEALPDPDEMTGLELELGGEEAAGSEWLPDSAPGELDYPENEAAGKAIPVEDSGFAMLDLDLTVEERPPVSEGTSFPEEDALLELDAELFPDDFSEMSLSYKHGKFDLGDQIIEFKKGIDQQVDRNDTQTHYDLGIAYKEMGLFDDAIAEFRSAAQDPSRKIDCLTLEGICLREKGDLVKAEEIFRRARALPGLSVAERLSLTYEQAFLYENVGKREDALYLYREVLRVDPDFRDAAQKISLLQGEDAPAGSGEFDLLDLDLEELE